MWQGSTPLKAVGGGQFPCSYLEGNTHSTSPPIFLVLFFERNRDGKCGVFFFAQKIKFIEMTLSLAVLSHRKIKETQKTSSDGSQLVRFIYFQFAELKAFEREGQHMHSFFPQLGEKKLKMNVFIDEKGQHS